MKKVCVITGTRAEYGLFLPILKEIKASPILSLNVIATTMHLSEKYGHTLNDILHDGFEVEVVENLLDSNSKTGVSKSTGLAIILLSEKLARLKPDIVLLLGDRFETHAAATTALLLGIPIGHIHGGEISEGAVDDQLRHSITKLSNYHFTSTEYYRQRVIQLGENPARVFNTGAPGIDNTLNMKLLSKEEIESNLDWKFGNKNILFTYHPVTQGTGKRSNEAEINLILEQLVELEDFSILFTYANADDGGEFINNKIESIARSDLTRFKVVPNLGVKRYLSSVKLVDIVLGNSSSGIIEAASFGKPVVNIGNRQKGRIQNKNVINCSPENVSLAIEKAQDSAFIAMCQSTKNLYGDGTAAHKIVSILEKTEFETSKHFFNIT